jgi:hypothetical protein
MPSELKQKEALHNTENVTLMFKFAYSTKQFFTFKHNFENNRKRKRHQLQYCMRSTAHFMQDQSCLKYRCEN